VHLVAIVRQAAQTNWRAALELLGRRWPETWGRHERVDVDLRVQVKPSAAHWRGRPDRNRPDSRVRTSPTRRSDAQLEQLIESLRSSGLLHPIGVRVLETGQLQLVHGQRRLEAARALAWRSIAATLHVS
jgi:hypothetical protein